MHTATQNTRGLPLRTIDCAISGSCNAANRRVDLQYAYDRNGNVGGITDYLTGGKQTRGMSYDGLDRLTQTTSNMFGTANYTYDTLDNLTRVQVGASSLYPARDHGYCYTNNRLTAVRTTNCSGTLVESLGYDVQGNITTKGSQSFTFDYGNRLRASGGSSQYRYDGHGRRVRYTTSGSAPYLFSQYDSSGQLRWQRDEVAGQRIRHIYLGNRLVAEHRKPIGNNTATIEYLHVDALGSPIARTNSAKATIESSEYEPYGRLVNRGNDDRPGYTGHVMDAATGLTYMQQRYYDPMLGLFLSVDPVTAHENPISQFHRYRYADSNPYSFIDPDGQQARDKDKQKVTGSHIAGSDVARAMLSNGNMSASAGGQGAGQGSSLAPRPDGRIPVPGVGGWKTGEPDMAWTPEQVDAAGVVISSTGVVVGVVLTRGALLRAILPNSSVGVSFGRNANQVYHTFRHVDKYGLNRNAVQRAVLSDLRNSASKIQSGRPFNQTVDVGGTKVTYTAYRLQDGTINVGRIVVP